MQRPYIPSDAEVRRVQETMGLDPMQAYYHCQGRAAVLQRIERERSERVAACIERFARQERDGSFA